MLHRFLNRPIGTPDVIRWGRLPTHPSGASPQRQNRKAGFLFESRYDAMLAEVASVIAGLGIMAVGTSRVFELDLDEPSRLLGVAVAVMLGLAIVGIGLLGGIKARLTPDR